MPSHYTHYRFGTSILATLPADTRRSIQRFRRLYDVGLHGPDLFYYSSPLTQPGTATLGVKYHEQTGRAFFGRICRAIRMERSEAATAYLYGVLCHYVLDSMLHPAVVQAAGECGVTHLELETEFERYLLECDHKLPPSGKRLAAHLKPTDGECDTVAKFYPPATAKSVRGALAASVRAIRLMAAPEGAGRTVLEKGLKLLGKESRGLLLHTKPDPRCTRMNEPLMEHYMQAVAEFPVYLEQIQAHMTYNAPLEQEFDHTFA